MAYLPLHHGKAPRWLIARMEKLANAIAYVIVSEYGTQTLLNRLSDPFWFQSFGCVLGYDWHSSGVTTVVTGVLKSALKIDRHGVAVAGGKGKLSRKTPQELEKIADSINLSTSDTLELVRASKLSAKVDNTAVQDGYSLYHHAFFVDERGNWVVVQQGMNVQDKTARRYHWNSSRVKTFVREPHEAIVGEKVRSKVLDLTALRSEECRKVSVDLTNEDPRRIRRMFKSITPRHQSRLNRWIDEAPSEKEYYCEVLSMPRRINWSALKKAYEIKPRNYEELLEIEGIGPSTIRGLALISEIIYGEPPSWRDPCKFSFAFGGKDGIPFPVDRQAMDEAHKLLEEAIEKAEIGRREQLQALERLRRALGEACQET